jgi:hypothetical protein
MTRHKTIGQDTPFLTYAIFKRIAARKAKEDKRKLLKKRIEAELRSFAYSLRCFIEKLIERRSNVSEDAIAIENQTQY